MTAVARRAVSWVAAALLALVLAPGVASPGEPLEARLVFPPGWAPPARTAAHPITVFKQVTTEVGDRYAGSWAPLAKGTAAVVVFCTNTADTHARVEPPAAPVFAGVSFTTGRARSRTPPAEK